jgi:hypothetical protein
MNLSESLTPDAPRIDLVGEEELNKTIEAERW